MYIEITQDGAGVISRNGAETGLFTSDLQTCCAYVFQGQDSIALVHDTGQLFVGGIKEIAEACGKLEAVSYVINPNNFGAVDSKRHRERRNRIRAVIKWKREVVKIEAPNAEIAVHREGRVLVGSEVAAEAKDNVAPLPEKDRRRLLNIMNNMFAPKNAQNVPPDLQYMNGAYRSFPRQLVSTREMEIRSHKELAKGDSHYQMVLVGAKNEGLIK